VLEHENSDLDRVCETVHKLLAKNVSPHTFRKWAQRMHSKCRWSICSNFLISQVICISLRKSIERTCLEASLLDFGEWLQNIWLSSGRHPFNYLQHFERNGQEGAWHRITKDLTWKRRQSSLTPSYENVWGYIKWASLEKAGELKFKCSGTGI